MKLPEMIIKFKQWILRVTAITLFIAGLLLIIILKPMLTYANKTTQHNYTIFHNQPIGKLLQIRLSQAEQLVTASEFHNPDLKLDICLNDGSNYPPLIEIIAGKAFARGFYNKVVLFGKADFENNFVELNGYRWNLTQLLVHEMIHCFQFDKLGIRQSNPIAKIDNWKWEGYPEYVARQNGDQKDLAQNIDRLLLTEKTDNHGWIQFSDSTGTVISYYKSWLLVKYCIDVKKMTYTQILTDKTREQMLQHQMERWYQQQK